MTVVGLTGPTGAGKGLVSSFFAGKGAVVLDCDALYHTMLREDHALKCELASAFPNCVTAGEIDRKKLGAVVFADREKLRLLEETAYRHITASVTRRIRTETEQGTQMLFLDAPTLFESGTDALCDVTVCVTAPAEVRKARIMARDGISAEAAEARMRNQHDSDWFRARCKYSLQNDSTPDALAAQAETVWAALTGSE